MNPHRELAIIRQRLATGAYGHTVSEILDLCDAVAEIQSLWSVEAVSEFQRDTGINPQVWRRFLKISADKRLREVSEYLPASYTSLYSITLLTDTLLNDGLVLKAIRPSISSRQIQSWIRESRMQVQSRLRILYLARDSDFDESDVERIVERINTQYLRHGFVLYSSIGDSDPERLFHESSIASAYARSELECTIEHLMYQEAYVVLPSTDPISLDDLLESNMKDFLESLMDMCPSRKIMMRRFGKLYCLKIALSHQRSDSRTDRYNYRRRLKQVSTKYPVLHDVAHDILERYCQ